MVAVTPVRLTSRTGVFLPNGRNGDGKRRVGETANGRNGDAEGLCK
jgi:hypothetical protein